jgi:hypothetical protein
VSVNSLLVTVALLESVPTIACEYSYGPMNKHCAKILQETLLNSVSNDLLPFMVGQSHDSFTLLSVNCEGSDVISALSAGHSRVVHGVQTGDTLKQYCVSSYMFLCP